MGNRRITTYEILVYIAYGYFLLIGLGWFFVSLPSSGFNYQAFAMIVIFGAQAYFKHKVTNLVIGLLMLGLSIFMTLQSIALGSAGGYDGFVGVMLATSIISIVMSIILIFSYTKLSFRDKE